MYVQVDQMLVISLNQKIQLGKKKFSWGGWIS